MERKTIQNWAEDLAVGIFQKVWGWADLESREFLLSEYRGVLVKAGVRFVMIEEGVYTDLVGERVVTETGRNFLRATGKTTAKITLARQEQKRK